MARMWDSVKVPWSGEPRCPLVPKLTSWLRSLTSGRRSKYSFSRRATSISIVLGAGLPARGESPGSFDTLSVCCFSKVWGMVPPSRYRLHIRRLCGHLRIFLNSPRSEWLSAPIHRDWHTDRPGGLEPDSKRLDPPNAYSDRHLLTKYRGGKQMLQVRNG